MRMFLFDIDGTLLWTGGAGSQALELAFAEVLGLAGGMAGVRCDGKTDGQIVREVLGPRGLDSPINMERVLAAYVTHLRQCLRRSTGYRVLPGVNASLDHLERHGIPCGLATGNLESGARAKLSPGGLNRYFPFGGFGSDAEDRTQLVRRAIERGRCYLGDPTVQAVVIGDTPRDVSAAHAAGALAVGVAAGNFDRCSLTDSGADLVLSDLTAPQRWVPRALALDPSSL